MIVFWGLGFVVTEPGLTPEQRQERVLELRGEADEAMADLRAKLAAVRESQGQALAVTGEASSRDGSVRAVVDATGVVTSLVFAPSSFERSTPEKLAQTAVATIQSAAAKARATVSETLAPIRAEGSAVLAAAAEGMPDLKAARLTVPQVPRTATDPADESDPWRGARSEPEPDSSSPLAGSRTTPPPAASRKNPPPAEDFDDPGAGGSVLNSGSW